MTPLRHALAVLLPAALLLAALPAAAQDNAYSRQAAPPPASSAAAVYESRLSDLESQLRALTGKIEQLEFANRQLGAQLQRAQSDNDMRMRSLEQNAAHQANVAAGMNASDAGDVLDAGAGGTAATAPVTYSTGPGGPPRPAPGTDNDGDRINLNSARPTAAEQQAAAPGTPQEQYDRAFALLRQANYDEAETAFKDFVAAHPGDKLSDNAKYWLAETYYVRGRHQDAAVAFAESYQAAPQGAKAPDSLLKLAMALSAMDKNKDACVALGELRDKFPNASTSVKSRGAQESKRLKCTQAAVARNTTQKGTKSKHAASAPC